MAAFADVDLSNACIFYIISKLKNDVLNMATSHFSTLCI
jgi:hypothetical protein